MDIDDLRTAVAASPELADLANTATRRHRLYQLIAESPDPLWREIGAQLRDGQLRPTQVLSVPEYREHLQAGMADGLANLTSMFGALEDHLHAETPAPVEENPAGDLSEEVDLSETLGPILRRR